MLSNRELILKKLSINPLDVMMDEPYFQRATKRIKGCQVDYLIHTRLNTLFVCEIKFYQSALKSTVITEVQDKIKRLVVPKNIVCVPVLIHVNGVNDRVVDEDYFYRIVNFTALLENDGN